MNITQDALKCMNQQSTITTTISTPVLFSIGTGSTSSTITITNPMYNFSTPELVSYEVLEDRVEFVYKQIKTPLFWGGINQVQSETVVYKNVVTFIDGKTVTTRVEGTYIPAQEEYYEFED